MTNSQDDIKSLEEEVYIQRNSVYPAELFLLVLFKKFMKGRGNKSERVRFWKLVVLNCILHIRLRNIISSTTLKIFHVKYLCLFVFHLDFIWFLFLLILCSNDIKLVPEKHLELICHFDNPLQYTYGTVERVVFNLFHFFPIRWTAK